MPTRPAQIMQLLQQREAEFHAFDERLFQGLHDYRQAAEQFQTLADGLGVVLEPLDSLRKGVFPWPLKWQSREDSLHWVREQLTGIATFAVDGSQIYPTKDFSLPVALIQIGWFENLHHPQGQYQKDIRLDILTPLQLRDAQGAQSEEGSDRLVNMRRFEMETERMREYMEDHAGDPRCLVFLDGSLVATFAQSFDGEMRAFYARCLRRLLQSSEDNCVPIVAYVDTSYARDLTEVLQRGFALPELKGIHDAQILHTLMEWGDRTPLLRCQRPILQEYYFDQKDRVGYVYLKTHEGYPARLELPLWIAEAGRLETILDWVRGEVIIGSGYPYVIETADQVAVLQADDRYHFYRILQDWAEQQGIHLRLSRKMVSKVRRR
jgi:NurA domain